MLSLATRITIFFSSLAWTRLMETYDIVMLIVLLGAMVFGAIKGFAWQLASIASIVISYIVAYKYREPFSQSIQAEPPWNRFLAMLILYVGTSLIIWVGFRMVRGSIERLKLREFDRQAGAMFGLAKGALYCILITLFSVTLSGDQVRESIVRSKSGNYIANVLDRSDSVIPPELHDVVQPYLDRFDEQFNDASSEDESRDNTWVAEGQQSLPNESPTSTSWGPSPQNTPTFQTQQNGSWGQAQPPQQARQPFGIQYQR